MQGKKAPLFCLPNEDGEEVCLKDFKGKKVVLYFYPRDMTPGCTIEAIDFTHFKKDFEKANTIVLGVSKDTVESHKKFCQKDKLSITLLSDTTLNTIKAYGAYGKKKFMGKEFMGIIRSTVLIDEKGIVEKHWNNVKALGHAEKVLEYIGAHN